MEYFLLLGATSKSVFMNEGFSQLSLTELYDKLSECTVLYSKSMKNGFSEKEFTELKLLIERLQKEIAHRRSTGGSGGDDSTFLFPPPQSASA